LLGQLTGQIQDLHFKHSNYQQDSYKVRLSQKENRDDQRVVLSNKAASLLNMGDGICLLVFHTKMNALDMDLLELTQKAIEVTGKNFDAMVIGNQGPAFSAGANLKMLAEFIEKKNWDGIDQMLRTSQGTMQMLKYAPFPTVSCPHGMTLGGGCEVSLHTSHRLITAETYAGLVEVGVGLIPGAGGTKEMALRAYDAAMFGEKTDPSSFIQKSFQPKIFIKNVITIRRLCRSFNFRGFGFYGFLNNTSFFGCF
jgi:3-hydroxyacyl-CoA dehydrogenase